MYNRSIVCKTFSETLSPIYSGLKTKVLSSLNISAEFLTLWAIFFFLSKYRLGIYICQTYIVAKLLKIFCIFSYRWLFATNLTQWNEWVEI